MYWIEKPNAIEEEHQGSTQRAPWSGTM